jgi:hypothetical protein
MWGKLIGAKQPPWIVVTGVESGSSLEAELVRCLSQYFTRVHFTTDDDVYKLHYGEFDAALVVGSPPSLPQGLPDHLCVLQFGGTPAVAMRSTDDELDGKPVKNLWALRWSSGATARQFSIPDNLVGEGWLSALIEASLIPNEGADYPHLTWNFYSGVPNAVDPEFGLRPLALDSAGQVLGARVAHGSGPNAGELWCLPTDALVKAAEWIGAAVRHWRAAGRDAFQALASWRDDPAWRTHGEDVATAAVVQRASEIEVIKAQLAEELETLAAQLQAAREDADTHERRLLTAQSEELVEEVARTLRYLGFTVVDADGLPEHSQGRKQEDLRVSDGDWVAVAEVKGYARSNAKARDLLQLGKAARVFAVHEKREPDAQWYFVNQSFETSPNDRAAPLASAREELEIFAADSGLVIDTRDLFRLHKAVEAGVVSKDRARQALRDATGVFHVPEEGSA